MNLDILSDWGIKALNCIKLSGEAGKDFEKLKWVIKYKGFITELKGLNQAIAQVQAIVKTKGLSNKTIKETEKVLSKIKPYNQRIHYFQGEIKKYLKETKAQLPKEEKVLCTSDIIESSFGKYKNYLYQNPMTGITNLSLCLAAFTNKLDAGELKEGLEKTTIKDLKSWSKDNIGETNLSKRRRVLQKIRV
jgi:predicted S18 family serine protease